MSRWAKSFEVDSDICHVTCSFDYNQHSNSTTCFWSLRSYLSTTILGSRDPPGMELNKYTPPTEFLYLPWRFAQSGKSSKRFYTDLYRRRRWGW